MIAEIFDALGSWTWFIFAMVLLGLEVLIAGTFLLWFGLAALLVGTVALMADLPWQIELAAFGVLSLVFLVLGRRYMKERLAEVPDPAVGLNQRAERHVGKVLTLTQALTDGEGSTHIGDTMWRVAGVDLPQGAKVKVVRAEGSLLIVEPA